MNIKLNGSFEDKALEGLTELGKTKMDILKVCFNDFANNTNWKEGTYCYFTPYINAINIYYEIVNIEGNIVDIEINEIEVDKDYALHHIYESFDKFNKKIIESDENHNFTIYIEE